MQCDNTNKSLEEWPTLGNVNNKNTTDGRVLVQADEIESNGNIAGASASAAENGPSVKNSKTKKKNSSRRTNWAPLPINPQPYRNNRGNGRRFDDSARPVENNRYHYNGHNHHHNGVEHGRGNGRGRGHRGYRGRGSSNYRLPREPIAAPEEAKTSSSETAGHEFGGAVFYPPLNCHSSSSKKHLKDRIRRQIEYYLSDENLNKDFYIRQKMDAYGYVPISLLANFNRMKHFADDLNLITEAVKESDRLEVLNDTMVRPVVNPLQWPVFNSSPLRMDITPVYTPYVSSEEPGEILQLMNGLDLNGSTYPSMPQALQCPLVPTLPLSFPPPHSSLNSVNGFGMVGTPSNSLQQDLNNLSHHTEDPAVLEVTAGSVMSVNGFDMAGPPSNCLEQDSNNLVHHADHRNPVVIERDPPYIHHYVNNAAIVPNSNVCPQDSSQSLEQVTDFNLPPSNSVIYFNNQSSGPGLYSVSNSQDELSSDTDKVEVQQLELNRKTPSR